MTDDNLFLVTGATGGLGRRIVRILRDRDKPVRAFVRLTSRYSELEQRGAKIFIGDLLRDKDIRKACQGVRYIISAHGSTEASGGAQELDYRANVELIDSAIEMGVEHFVFISVLGADRGYEDSPVFKAKREVERYLKSSGLNYTILRPSGFASNLLPLAERFRDTGIYILIGDPKIRSSIVSTDDLARMAVDSVAIESAKNQTFAVGGPDVLKREEIPQIFSHIFNREPKLINPPLFLLDGVRRGVGFFSSNLQKSLGTLRVLLANEFFCTTDEIDRLQSVYEIKLESLEAFIRRYLVTGD
ncbi:MAG TPA: SDR family oxidoreductase [Oscillatoriales cyanobacterium M59_W2019_021]|nr:MAG: SDR family oxidoreductase [Cyanobacteria bacterium J055]HIK33087.1 SDR family oxidoreductase [Oscillatoriales cyanobacterium M4454_W2019_049]HIK53012.1 SDR family oxidoreductase [Oscillatoriales cyanobacterium M59_W2019_021]